MLCAACYTQPAFDDPCAIACTTTCPGTDVCGGDGLCHGAGSGECSAPPVPQLAYVTLEAGARSTCALGSDGAAYCWGDGGLGQLGVAGLVTAAAPTRVGSASDRWDALAVGADHACALAGGVVKCWGQDRDGASSGANGSTVPVPDLVTFPADAIVPRFDAIAAGGFHSCALGSGQLWCWGLDEAIGVVAQTAAQIAPATAWRAVSTGVDHTCGVTAAGEIDCWGANDDAQCGVAPGGPIALPTAVALPGDAPVTTVVRVVAGSQRTCAILSATAGATAGELWCWGDNSFGVIDGTQGAASQIATPTRVGTDETWTAIALGHQLMCGVRAGAATCWGQSNAGALGDGKWSTDPLAYSAMRAIGSADAITVGAGQTSGGVDDTACLLAGGAALCWGDNFHGAAGFGAAAKHLSPVPVAPPTGETWARVFGGERHMCGTTTDGALWCWGDDEVGQVSATAGLGDAEPCTSAQCDAPRPVAAPVAAASEVSIGVDFTCALAGSAVSCWGTGSAGELGGAPTTAHALAAVPGAFAHLLGGGRATCAAPVAGDPPLCWGTVAGSVVEGPTSPGGAAAAGVTAFAFGDAFGCALEGAAGGAHRVCWGRATNYELGNNNQTGAVAAPTDLGGDTLVQLAAASDHACAITAAGNVTCWGENFHEQCGQHGVSTVDAPTLVDDASGAPLAACTRVAQSDAVTCAICGGHVACWGEHDTGRGTDTVSPPSTPVAIDLVGTHAFVDLAVRTNGGCALDDQGALFCWGTSLHGENGDGGHGANLPTRIAAPAP